jgi:hypothetical protein
MRAVSRPVFASPTVTAVNLDSSRGEAANPAPCYPDACFAVDNFDAAFEELVLSEPEHCYCVVLHALLDGCGAGSGGGAWRPSAEGSEAAGLAVQQQQQEQQQEQEQQENQQQEQRQQQQQAGTSGAEGRAVSTSGGGGGGGGSSASDAPGDAWRIGTRRRCLFAGYVSYEQIVDFIAQSRGPTRNLLDALLGPQPNGGKDRVVMTGPGGVGRAEVAVTRLAETPAARSGGGDASGGAAASGGGKGSSGGLADAQEQPPQQQRQEPGGSGGSGGGALGVGGLLQRGFMRARLVASGLQKALEAEFAGGPAAAGGTGSGEASGGGAGGGGWRVQCALMLLKLPVEHLARELLEGF